VGDLPNLSRCIDEGDAATFGDAQELRELVDQEPSSSASPRERGGDGGGGERESERVSGAQLHGTQNARHYMHIHTHTHTCTHLHMHTHTHTHTHTCTYVYVERARERASELSRYICIYVARIYICALSTYT
jgi:hypothetical protein